MPISPNNFMRSTAALLLVGFLALAAIVGTTLWLVEQNQRFFDQSTQARIARADTVSLRNSLQEAENGQRGFVLTQEESYLAPYNAALPLIPDQLARLHQVLAPFPEANEAMVALDTTIADKLAELDETITLVRQGRTEDALTIVRTNRGRDYMEQARTLFTGIIDAADDLIVSSLNEQRFAINALRWTTIIGAVVILMTALGAAWVALVYTRELAGARQEVEAANHGLEDRVRERTADLGKANEEIQRFAYIVTHDLRAPLVNIMGFTSELETGIVAVKDYMAKQDGATDPAFRDAQLAATEDLPEAVGFIRSSTKKMDGLINAILKISREGRRQLRPETVKLNDLVQASAAAVQHQIVEKGGSVDIDIRVPTLVSDRLSLEQVMGNLFDNAIKYQQPGRPLQLAVRAHGAPFNRLVIEVEDNGRGIANTDHERIFELFRRSGQQTQPGEGIGLAHVRTMVRSLGGDITVRSELGVGSTFVINLPRDLRGHLESHSP